MLNSQEIPETVTAIDWLNNAHTTQPKLLVSNARQVKLFKLRDRQAYEIHSVQKRVKKGKGLSFPVKRVINQQKEGKLLEVFKTDKE